MSYKTTAWVLVCLATLTGLGCGSVKRNPVEGKALVAGRPLPRGQVVFHPTDVKQGDPLTIVGSVSADGTYKMTTNGKPGVPAGKYRVTINTIVAPQGADPARPLPVAPRPAPYPVRLAHPGYEALMTSPLVVEVPSNSYDLAMVR